MSGKRAKPSPWRFLRLVPVALVSMAVCAMVGLFLLMSGSGDDQAHDWGIGPVPSDSQEHSTGGPETSPGSSPEPTASDPTTPGEQTTTLQQRDASPDGVPSPEPPARNVQVRRASASVSPSPTPPRGTRAPVSQPSAPVTGPAKDNPGKKKGHDKAHGPHAHPNR